VDPVSPELARALNEQIALLARKLAGGDDPEYRYAFTCESGCGDIVSLSLVEYKAAGGAWLDGHRPAELSD